MKPEMQGKVKFGSWGLICGAVITIIIGFSWGGWTTAATTQTMSEEAVLASQAAICVGQFMKDPDHAAKLEEFGKISSWERAKFIEKGGWDKIPGHDRADYALSSACADGIAQIKK